MSTETHTYVGRELDLFAHAVRWKAYFRAQITSYLGANVLEVGAGIGATTQTLCPNSCQKWVCLEPDPDLASTLRSRVDSGEIPSCCQVSVGTLASMDLDSSYDTILYIDVLEHIEDDAGELVRAAQFLRPGGHLVVLSPAHQWLYSPFDREIGHYRRYNKKMLVAIAPDGARCVALKYLDAAGLLLSLGNRCVLHSQMPTLKQIKWWDRHVIPVSRVIDAILGFRLGKSIVAVWQKA